MVLIKRALGRLVDIRPGEHRMLIIAFVYFFTLLGSYYLVRSIRDAMGLAAGEDSLQLLYLLTIGVMLALVPLFGWVSARWPRQRFIPYSYYFCAAMQLLFAGLFYQFGDTPAIARAFYIWVNVYNLFVVSVFWSFMTDLFNREQAARLFGFIAAGGSCGAALGPLLTALMVQSFGVTMILILSALFLLLSILCVQQLNQLSLRNAPHAKIAESTQGLGGGAWDGLRLATGSRYLAGIAAIMLCYSLFSTFMYFQQLDIIGELYSDTAARSVMFARIDLLVNVLTIICQLFFTGRIIKSLGISWTLALVPLLLSIGLLLLALAPLMGWSLLVIILGLQVVRRVGSYALINPARETLYVLLSREEKYKAKNFIDTSVVRAGDMLSVAMLAVLKALGLALGGMALLSLLVTIPWLLISFWLGREHKRRSD